MSSRLRLLLAFFCASPLAATAADNLHWRCWYDQQEHITCIIDSLPDNDAPGAELSLPSNLPGIVKTLRKDPGAFRSRLLHIPLHTTPYDDIEFTALLARATVCGSRPDCTVNFTSTPAPAGEIVALLNKNLQHLHRESPAPHSATLALLENGD